mmetsp:Transcript_97120/g.172941  ORF Transcript_97120/g.172941 Transcript_97120/m.172941 type:complete len:614 (+) Transcript_97120:121-1962(+)
MPPILVRLNLPGFSSPEPFRLDNAATSLAGLACAVLEEIGNFSKEELDGIRDNIDRVPLTLLGELCAGQLVELASDAQLEVFLATAESPRKPATIEVRPKDAPLGDEVAGSTSASPNRMQPSPVRSPSGLEPQVPQKSGQDTGLTGHFTNGSSANYRQAPPSESMQQRQQLLYEQQMQLEEEKRQIQEQLRQQQLQLQQELQQRQEMQLQQQMLQQKEQQQMQRPQQLRQPQPQQPPQSRPAPETSFTSSSSSRPPPRLQQSPSAPALVNGGSDHQLDRSLLDHSLDSSLTAPRGKPAQQGSRRQLQGSRTHTPDSQRRSRDEEARPSSRAPSTGRQKSSREERQPVHLRLYQDKDDRRRRQEEARLRHIEQEQEDIRLSAQNTKALRRQPSPGRAPSPQRDPSPGPEAGSAAGSFRGRPRAGVDHSFSSPLRQKPPLPERAGSGPGSSKSVANGQGRGSNPFSSHSGQVREASSRRASSPQPPPMPGDASSVASESGAAGLPSNPSLTDYGPEEGDYGDVAPDVHQLREQVASQQQRIEFLENMHQQALRQVRKSREELAQVQQMRFKEADKVLGLEQLISEMQVQRFDGDPQMQLRWEEWLHRARDILEGD